MPLRDYQQGTVDDVVPFLMNGKAGERRLYAGPTGVGKSYIINAIMDAVPHAWCITPKVEIVEGMLSKRGVDCDSITEKELWDIAYAHRITTPIRVRNRLMAGDGPDVGSLIFDEGHHNLASSWQDIHLLCGVCPAVAFTASPYRGTAKGTEEFRKVWGDPRWIITFAEAAALGDVALPECQTVPLVDDDLIEVVNGELVATGVSEATMSRVDAIADMSREWFDANSWDIPTLMSAPSVDTALALAGALRHRALPACAVTGGTDFASRREMFKLCLERRLALIQVSVISEGVDLPLRRLVDCAPTLSPVRWVQQFGRITRPAPIAPHYVCTNRNLQRHAYVLEGALPSRYIKEAQDAFMGPSKRSAARALGLERLGRLKACELPLDGGLKGLCYSFGTTVGIKALEYFVIVLPSTSEPIWATRANGINPSDGTRTYGTWSRCDAPEGVEGFASKSPGEPSPKQIAWWKNCAKRYGLDPEAPISRKNFASLPVLSDLRLRIKP